MTKDKHVFTLNHDVHALEHKPQTETKLVVKASNDYHINDTKGITDFNMIESVDDLMVILQEHSEEKPDDKTIINLIYKGNQLSGLFFESKDAGYEPSITYDAGRLTSIRLSFFKNSLSVIIKKSRIWF